MNEQRRSQRISKTFFERTNSGVLTSKDALNEYLSSLGVSDDQFNRHMFLSSCGKWIYHISIIDYLQKWNATKRQESFAKKWFLGKDPKKISATEPNFYAKRFLSFAKRNILIQRKAEEMEDDFTNVPEENKQ